MALAIIIYATAEYPETVHLDYPDYAHWQVIQRKNPTISYLRLEDLTLYFDNEIIAVTDDVNQTLWLNPAWANAPYVVNELLPTFPLKNP